MADNEKQFEIDIEASLTSAEGGWQKATDAGYRAGIQVDSMGAFQENYALDIDTLCAFVKATQPVAWALFEKRCKSDPQRKFYKAFQNAVDMDGLVNVLRHGFKHRGQEFKVIYFKPETELNQVSLANYGKNIFVGCGGSSMINSSHMLGAFYGMERIMGRDFSPVRRVFDYAQEHFLSNIPLVYVLTTTTNKGDDVTIHGLYIGTERAQFEAAVKKSQEINLTHMDKRLNKVVVYLDPREFKSTWLGNKSIYRTRMAIADGGELIVLAPAVAHFGEDEENDRLIRKYGYVGRENVLKLVEEHEDLRENLSVAAHLIHGSSDGRFKITYCAGKLTEEEVRGAAFNYMPYEQAVAKYDPAKLVDGFNTVDGEEIFYISNPALGLWVCDK